MNTVKFTRKKYVILKKEAKNKQNTYSELEDKIIELSLQLKGKSNELNEVIAVNNLLLKKLIHNLKNPIGVSFSFSEMILEGLPNYQPERLKNHIEIIKNSSEFSLNFLNKLAEFSRYQLPDLKFSFLTQNLSKVVQEVVDKLQLNAHKKNIKIALTLPPNDVIFNFDKDELFIAISNILNNAIRFSGENTTIAVVVENKNDNITIRVTDQGMGISENDISTIFNEFFVVNTYANDKSKCIGLGLPIASKIIKRHGGKIAVISEIEKGTTFTVTLPNNK
jgi:signal transduction histidine kinase